MIFIEQLFKWFPCIDYSLEVFCLAIFVGKFQIIYSIEINEILLGCGYIIRLHKALF